MSTGHERVSERLEKEEGTCSFPSVSWGLSVYLQFPWVSPAVLFTLTAAVCSHSSSQIQFSHTCKLLSPTKTSESAGHILLQDLDARPTGLPISNSESPAPISKCHLLRGLSCSSTGVFLYVSSPEGWEQLPTLAAFWYLKNSLFTLSVINNTIPSSEQFFLLNSVGSNNLCGFCFQMTDYYRVGGLKNKHFFLTVLESGSPRWRFQHSPSSMLQTADILYPHMADIDQLVLEPL